VQCLHSGLRTAHVFGEFFVKQSPAIRMQGFIQADFKVNKGCFCIKQLRILTPFKNVKTTKFCEYNGD
jgi:hypothetical protein